MLPKELTQELSKLSPKPADVACVPVSRTVIAVPNRGRHKEELANFLFEAFNFSVENRLHYVASWTLKGSSYY